MKVSYCFIIGDSHNKIVISEFDCGKSFCENCRTSERGFSLLVNMRCCCFSKGRVPKNKMEISNGVFHEGVGGSRVPLRFFNFFGLETI